MIKPVQVAIDVPQPRPMVYDFLDVMANHEGFTDHGLKDWVCSGPERGVGSKARVRSTLGGRTDVIDIEVVSARAPAEIVEQNVGAKGRRVANGTYRLHELPDGGTRIEFEYRFREAPFSERLAAPLARSMLKSFNQKAMQRLADSLSQVAGAN